MKRISLLILLLVCIVVTFNSCDNGAYNADPSGNVSTAPNPIYQPPGSGTVEGTCVCKDPFSVDIDAKEWVADTAYIAADTVVMGAHILSITGRNKMGASPDYTVTISFGQYHGTGTYSLAPNNGNAFAEFVDAANLTNFYISSATGGGGTILVTKDSGGQLQAKFSCTAFTSDGKNSHKFTGGWINVKH